MACLYSFVYPFPEIGSGLAANADGGWSGQILPISQVNEDQNLLKKKRDEKFCLHLNILNDSIAVSNFDLFRPMV